MSTPAPTYHLPACPVCSTLLALYRPVWRFAQHTSARSGKPAYFLIGCHHVSRLADSLIMRREPAEWAALEAAWTAKAAELFKQRTERWSDIERNRFRDVLNDKPFLPGTTRELALAEAGRDPKRDSIARQLGEALDEL